MNTNNRLYVANLPRTGEETQIIDKVTRTFLLVGPIVKVVLFRHNQGCGPLSGTGLIEYQRPRDAYLAIKTLNNLDFSGRKLYVTFYRDRNGSSTTFSTHSDDEDDDDDNENDTISMLSPFISSILATRTDNILSNSAYTNKILNCNSSSLTKEQNIQNMINICMKLEDSHTKQMIQRKFGLNSNDNFEILEDYYKLSLICSLTKKRLEIPARGINCQHLECFDLRSYLDLSYELILSTCPICKGYFNKSSFRIDSFVSKILSDPLTKDLKEVNIDRNCDWFKVLENDKSCNNINKGDVTILIDSDIDETIIIDDDDDDNDNDANDENDDDQNKICKSDILCNNNINDRNTVILNDPKEKISEPFNFGNGSNYLNNIDQFINKISTILSKELTCKLILSSEIENNRLPKPKRVYNKREPKKEPVIPEESIKFRLRNRARK